MARLTRPALIVLAGLVAGYTLPWHWHHPVVHVRVSVAGTCPDATGTPVTVVGYDLEQPTRRTWTVLHDDGTTRIEARAADGTWRAAPSTSGGEHVRRLTGAPLPALTPVRAVYGSWRSSTRLVASTCPD